jgi:hypothetical protein
MTGQLILALAVAVASVARAVDSAPIKRPQCPQSSNRVETLRNRSE